MTESCIVSDVDSFYGALLHMAADPAFLLNELGQPLRHNQLAADLFGADLNALEAWNLSDLFQDSDDLTAALATTVKTLAPATCRARRKATPDYLHLHFQSIRLSTTLRIIAVTCESESPLIPNTAESDLNASQSTSINTQESSQRREAERRVSDLTNETRRLEELMAQKERVQAQLSTVLSAVAQGIIQVSQEGRILMVNRAAIDLFGYREQELLDQPVELLIPRTQRSDHENHRKNFMRNPSARTLGVRRELWGLHKNGTLIPIEISLNPIQQEDGIQIVASIVDITERRNQQREMMDKTKSLERSNEELKDFAYIATHDLKEPLRGISNYAMFLLEDYEPFLDSEGKEMIHSIVRLSGRMEQFITELLHYSRVGQTELAPGNVNLGEVVQEVLEALGPRLNALQVDVKVEALPNAACDRMLVRQIFLNLISNAMKYNDKVEKWIRVGCQVRNGKRVYFVQDNGIGIPKPFHDRIFKIFKRLHAQDRFEGGTGVGLAIVKKIVARHGGDVWLESQEGEGTTFFFTLS